MDTNSGPTTGTELKITQTKVGAVIHYINSKKLYLVASLTVKGNVQSRLLYSFTQHYNSTKNNFNVIQLIEGKGEITKDIEDEYNQLIDGKFRFKKNKKYSELYEAVQRKLKGLE